MICAWPSRQEESIQPPNGCCHTRIQYIYLMTSVRPWSCREWEALPLLRPRHGKDYSTTSVLYKAHATRIRCVAPIKMISDRFTSFPHNLRLSIVQSPIVGLSRAHTAGLSAVLHSRLGCHGVKYKAPDAPAHLVHAPHRQEEMQDRVLPRSVQCQAAAQTSTHATLVLFPLRRRFPPKSSQKLRWTPSHLMRGELNGLESLYGKGPQKLSGGSMHTFPPRADSEPSPMS